MSAEEHIVELEAALQAEREARERAERWLAEYSGWSPHQFTGLLEEHGRLQSAHVALDARRYAAEALVAQLRSDLATEERAHIRTIEERDHHHEAADELAYALFTIEEIGEHSNMNDPWENAASLLAEAGVELTRLRSERAEAVAALERILDMGSPFSSTAGAAIQMVATLHARLTAGETAQSLESRVADWVRTRIGPEHMNSRERAMRLLEESVELAQAEGIGVDLVAKQVAHVYARPAGEPVQEAAGIAVCLLGWCASAGVTFADIARREIERIEAKPIEQIHGSLARKADADLVTCAVTAGAKEGKPDA